MIHRQRKFRASPAREHSSRFHTFKFRSVCREPDPRLSKPSRRGPSFCVEHRTHLVDYLDSIGKHRNCVTCLRDGGSYFTGRSCAVTTKTAAAAAACATATAAAFGARGMTLLRLSDAACSDLQPVTLALMLESKSCLIFNQMIVYSNDNPGP